MPKQRGKAQRRQPVELPRALEPGVANLASEVTWERRHITGDPTSDETVFTDVDLADVRWSSAGLSGRTFRDLRCRNVVFDTCDLSGAVFQDCGFKRVEFRGCRMTGAALAGSTLTDVLLAECKLDLANLRMVRAARLDVVGSDLREAELSGAELATASLRDCDLSGTEFSGAVLDCIRLHGSVLSGVKGISALAGAAIDRNQVLDVAMALFDASGFVIEDP